MTRILLLSDTHGFLPEGLADAAKGCHEVWHGGDFGNIELAKAIQQITALPLRGVYGNIDGYDIRSVYPEQLVFNCEAVKVMIRHIGGYPPKYNTETKAEIAMHRPQLFISGHSHILKIMYDPHFECLHINPGAAGKQGWHKIITLVKFDIDGDKIRNCNIIELGTRSDVNGKVYAAG